jgi:hypothetical protein
MYNLQTIINKIIKVLHVKLAGSLLILYNVSKSVTSQTAQSV